MKFSPSDAVIIGVDTDGCLLFKDTGNGMEFNGGDTPEEWGWDNMTEEEKKIVKAALESKKQ